MDVRHTGANGLLCARCDPAPNRAIGFGVRGPGAGGRRYQMSFVFEAQVDEWKFHYPVAQGGGGTEEG